jgi:hypothetical protein
MLVANPAAPGDDRRGQDRCVIEPTVERKVRAAVRRVDRLAVQGAAEIGRHADVVGDAIADAVAAGHTPGQIVEVAATYEEPILAALARFESQYGDIVTEYFETLLRLANVPPWRILYGPVLPPTIGPWQRPATPRSIGYPAI